MLSSSAAGHPKFAPSRKRRAEAVLEFRWSGVPSKFAQAYEPEIRERIVDDADFIAKGPWTYRTSVPVLDKDGSHKEYRRWALWVAYGGDHVAVEPLNAESAAAISQHVAEFPEKYTEDRP